MPHARLTRPSEVAGAVLRIVVRDGLDAVTAPAVAEEAGRSSEWLRDELSTEELLLRLTLTHSIDVLDRRIAAHASASGRPVGGLLGAMAEETVPGGEEAFAPRRNWLSCLARAAAGADLADPVRVRFGAAHRDIRRGLGHAVPDAGTGARTTAALIDGLTAHVLVGLCTRRQAVDALAAHLARS